VCIGLYSTNMSPRLYLVFIVAALSCSLAASQEDIITSEAQIYGSDDPFVPVGALLNGSCGYGVFSPEVYPNIGAAAISPSSPLASSAPQQGCGICLQITCQGPSCLPNARPATVTVADSCSDCSSDTIVIHSSLAITLTGSPNKNIPISWRQIPCQPPGGIIIDVDRYRVDAGGYIRLAFLNVAGSGEVEKVELKGSMESESQWRVMENGWGARYEVSRFPATPLDLRVTTPEGVVVMREVLEDPGETGRFLSAEQVGVVPSRSDDGGGVMEATLLPITLLPAPEPAELVLLPLLAPAGEVPPKRRKGSGRKIIVPAVEEAITVSLPPIPEAPILEAITFPPVDEVKLPLLSSPPSLERDAPTASLAPALEVETDLIPALAPALEVEIDLIPALAPEVEVEEEEEPIVASPPPPKASPPPVNTCEGNLYQIIQDIPQLSTFASYVNQTGYASLLEDASDSLTVFAPINSAWPRIQSELTTANRTNSLEDVIAYLIRVGPVAIDPNAVPNAAGEIIIEVETVGGEVLFVVSKGGSFLVRGVGSDDDDDDDAELRSTERGCNGAVNILSAVPLPF